MARRSRLPLRKAVLRDERGLTLIELVVSLMILGLLMLALGMVTVNVMKMTARNRNHLIAIREVQAVGQWITRDGQQSEPYFVGTSDDPGTIGEIEVLQLGWDYTADPFFLDKYEISYVLQADHRLRRDVVINDVAASSVFIASNIVSVQVPASGTYFIARVTAATGGFESVTRFRDYAFQCRAIGVS